MQIVKALVNNAAELTALVNSAYRGETSKQGWTTESHLLDGERIDEAEFAIYLQDPRITILKAVGDDGRAHGCVYLERQGSKLYLGMLTVSPALQDQGIGRKLLDAAYQQASKLGCAAIMITVISTRYELLSWYKRRGFAATGEMKPLIIEPKFGIPKQPIELMVMELPVKPNA